MRDKITQVLRNTFSLESDKPLDLLLKVPEAQHIKKLPELLSRLMSPTSYDKELATLLEDIVIRIKLKEKQTPKEGEFLMQVDEIINKPLFAEGSHQAFSLR